LYVMHACMRAYMNACRLNIRARSPNTTAHTARMHNRSITAHHVHLSHAQLELQVAATSAKETPRSGSSSTKVAAGAGPIRTVQTEPTAHTPLQVSGILPPLKSQLPTPPILQFLKSHSPPGGRHAMPALFLSLQAVSHSTPA
jgi:hypothetical protein